MDYLLVTFGIAIIIFALWSDRLKEVNQKKNLDNYKQLQSDLEDSKKEVEVLLQQLEAASERIVEEISFGLEEIESTAQKLAANMSPEKITADTVQISTGENYDEVEVEKATHSQSMLRTNAETSVQVNGRTGRNAANNTVVFPTLKGIENKQKNSAEIKQSHNLEQMPPKHQMVCSMAKMGYSEEDIAKQMSIGKGEVRLILKLKRKGEEANA